MSSVLMMCVGTESTATRMGEQELVRTIRHTPGVWHISMVAQAVANQHVEGVFLIAQVSQLLVTFIKNHTCQRAKLPLVC